jgi:hypothetical protein
MIGKTVFLVALVRESKVSGVLNHDEITGEALANLLGT